MPNLLLNEPLNQELTIFILLVALCFSNPEYKDVKLGGLSSISV